MGKTIPDLRGTDLNQQLKTQSSSIPKMQYQLWYLELRTKELFWRNPRRTIGFLAVCVAMYQLGWHNIKLSFGLDGSGKEISSVNTKEKMNVYAHTPYRAKWNSIYSKPFIQNVSKTGQIVERILSRSTSHDSTKYFQKQVYSLNSSNALLVNYISKYLRELLLYSLKKLKSF